MTFDERPEAVGVVAVDAVTVAVFAAVVCSVVALAVEDRCWDKSMWSTGDAGFGVGVGAAVGLSLIHI